MRASVDMRAPVDMFLGGHYYSSMVVYVTEKTIVIGIISKKFNAMKR